MIIKILNVYLNVWKIEKIKDFWFEWLIIFGKDEIVLFIMMIGDIFWYIDIMMM